MVILGLALLAGAGAVARWQLTALNTGALPYGTLTVNVIGAFVFGVLHDSGGDTRTLVGVALLGTLSTFSTLIRELVDATESGDFTLVARYLTVTVVLGVAAAWMGVQLS